jgi:hypothetical protein
VRRARAAGVCATGDRHTSRVEQGHARAQLHVGVRSERGLAGVAQDVAEAVPRALLPGGGGRAGRCARAARPQRLLRARRGRWRRTRWRPRAATGGRPSRALRGGLKEKGAGKKLFLSPHPSHLESEPRPSSFSTRAGPRRAGLRGPVRSAGCVLA